MCCAQSLSHVRLSVTPWAVARQAPLSMGFSRQEDWSGLPCLPPRDLPGPGIEPMSPVSPALQEHSSPLSHRGSPSYPPPPLWWDSCILTPENLVSILFLQSWAPLLSLASEISRSTQEGPWSPRQAVWRTWGGCVFPPCSFMFVVVLWFFSKTPGAALQLLSWQRTPDRLGTCSGSPRACF